MASPKLAQCLTHSSIINACWRKKWLTPGILECRVSVRAISLASGSFQDSGPSTSLALPGPAREGNFAKLQSPHHEKAMSLLGGAFRHWMGNLTQGLFWLLRIYASLLFCPRRYRSLFSEVNNVNMIIIIIPYIIFKLNCPPHFHMYELL